MLGSISLPPIRRILPAVASRDATGEGVEEDQPHRRWPDGSSGQFFARMFSRRDTEHFGSASLCVVAGLHYGRVLNM